ncbi:MAG: VanZ family protein [Clostridiales bacterium]|jgi:glycopeptide antibiotics resistance protein|nr:VanZ family protein [Clostridiales bacterium]
MEKKLSEQTKSRLTKAGWLLFYFYLILLSYFLFFSEHYGRGSISEEYRYNLELFKEIKRFIKYREILGIENFIVNILGNVLAFTPFGFFLPCLKKKYRRFILVAFLSILFSLMIESLQLYSKVGIFDVDDILMNSIGGMLGYMAFKVVYFVLQRFHNVNR